MPLAALKFDTFWESTAPTTLASFIANATDSNGNVLQPTRPVAKPGPNRTVPTNIAAKLSAAESVHATSYRWRVSSGNFANTILLNANTIRPTFTATANGTYTLELIVSNGATDSAPATLTVFANSTIADPASIRFADIRSILQGAVAPATGCTASTCHVDYITDPTFGPGGPPVYYTDYDRDGSGGAPNTADLHQFYLDIRARINFTDIESSKILTRPSGHHHPGDLRPGFDINNQVDGNRTHYDTFLNWIQHGAPE
jgi:hypothetical protein